MLLQKAKLDAMKDLISKVLINSYISYDEIFLVNNVLKEKDKIKEEIKNA